MKRRGLLTTTVGMTALVGCLDGGPEDDDAGDDDDPAEPPFEIVTIDAPGSEAGTVTVPDASRPMLCNFTRTECPTSRALLSTIAEAKTRLENEGYAVDGAEPDVRFLSLTDGSRDPSPTDDELAAWFDENDGNWPLGRDESGGSYDYYDIRGYPTMVVIDSTDAIHWRNRSGSSPGNIVSAVTDAIEAPADGAATDSSGGNESATADRIEH